MQIPILSNLSKRSKTFISNPADWLLRFFNMGRTPSSVTVNDFTALNIPGVWVCCKVLIESITTCPANLYRRLPNGGKELAIDHPVFHLLRSDPNRFMTSSDLFGALESNRALRGNAYAHVHWDGSGYPSQIVPLQADRMTIEVRNGEPLYTYNDWDGGINHLHHSEIIHVKNTPNNGWWGFSPLAYSDSLSITIQAQEYANSSFKNSSIPGLALEAPKALSDSQFERLSNYLKKNFKGSSNAMKTAIFEEGIKANVLGFSQRDAQLLETRQFQIQELCRIFRVALPLAMDYSGNSFANVLELGKQHVRYTMQPIVKAYAQALERVLLTKRERFESGLFIRFDLMKFLEADFLERIQAYWQLYQMAAISPDEIRNELDWNPRDEAKLGDYVMPLNVVPVNESQLFADLVAKPKLEQTDDGSDGNDDSRSLTDIKIKRADEKTNPLKVAAFRLRLRRQWSKVMKAQMTKVVRGEIREIRKMVDSHLKTRDGSSFQQALSDYYSAEETKRFIRNTIGGVMESYAEAIADATKDELQLEELRSLDDWVSGYIDKFTEALGGIAISDLQGVLERATDDIEGEVNKRLDAWNESKADILTNSETNNLESKLYKYIGIGAGLSVATWHTRDDACPICKKLDGKQIPLKNGSWTGEKGEAVFSPPLHYSNGSCNCYLTMS